MKLPNWPDLRFWAVLTTVLTATMLIDLTLVAFTAINPAVIGTVLATKVVLLGLFFGQFKRAANEQEEALKRERNEQSTKAQLHLMAGELQAIRKAAGLPEPEPEPAPAPPPGPEPPPAPEEKPAP